MNKTLRHLQRRYAAALRKYLAEGREEVLVEANKLGRSAIGRGVGILDMAAVHEQTLKQLSWPSLTPQQWGRFLKAKETFLLEALTPFEVTHRGFRETNLRLQELIKTLEKRNQSLETEIQERKRTEEALRESEEKFRTLFLEARRMEESLRDLSNQVLYVQEEERKRISRELHDEIGQALTAISMNLEVIRNNGAAGSGPGRQRLADTQRLLQQTMETVHDFARELRPSMLDELGLLPALRSYLKNFAARTGLRVRFRSTPAVEALNDDQKMVVFRVAQESLTNVAKHARASRVNITISELDKGISMKITDNGRSFRLKRRRRRSESRRLGVLGMRERVRLIHGTFQVEPRPGHGTTVRVVLPAKLKANPAGPLRKRERKTNR